MPLPQRLQGLEGRKDRLVVDQELTDSEDAFDVHLVQDYGGACDSDDAATVQNTGEEQDLFDATTVQDIGVEQDSFDAATVQDTGEDQDSIDAATVQDTGKIQDNYEVHMTQDCLVYSATDMTSNTKRLALSDTCCSRSVVGERWIQRHMKLLVRRGHGVYVIDEAKTFRFGGSPRVASQYAVIVPLLIEGSKQPVTIRVSVVQQEVPLLIGRNALMEMGAVMDLAEGEINFHKLETKAKLHHTETGLCGFYVDHPTTEPVTEVPWEYVVESDAEICIGAQPSGRDSLMARTPGLFAI